MKKALVLAALAVGAAYADIVPQLDLSSAGVTCGSNGGSEVQCTYNYTATVEAPTSLKAGSTFTQYFTIYDFNGYVAGSAVAGAGFTQDDSVVLTPSKVMPTNGSAPDLTFVFTGTSDIPGGTVIGGFSAKSIYGPGTQFSNYASVTTLTIKGENHQNQNVGDVLVPKFGQIPPSDTGQIPEPMSMGLLGGGLVGLALLPRRFRK